MHFSILSLYAPQRHNLGLEIRFGSSRYVFKFIELRKVVIIIVNRCNRNFTVDLNMFILLPIEMYSAQN